MSLTGPDWSAEGWVCFYCAEPCRDPVVHWMGAASAPLEQDDLPLELRPLSRRLGGLGEAMHIYLHSGCVLELFVRLARDVWELRMRDKKAS